MKTLILILFTIPIFSQVGIGTTNPQNDLHVSGGILVEDLPYLGMGSILIADEDGNIGRLNCPNCPPPWQYQFKILIRNLENLKNDIMNESISRKRKNRVLRNFSNQQINRIKEEAREEFRRELLEESRKRMEASEKRLNEALEKLEDREN